MFIYNYNFISFFKKHIKRLGGLAVKCQLFFGLSLFFWGNMVNAGRGGCNYGFALSSNVYTVTTPASLNDVSSNPFGAS